MIFVTAVVSVYHAVRAVCLNISEINLSLYSFNWRILREEDNWKT